MGVAVPIAPMSLHGSRLYLGLRPRVRFGLVLLYSHDPREHPKGQWQQVSIPCCTSHESVPSNAIGTRPRTPGQMQMVTDAFCLRSINGWWRVYHFIATGLSGIIVLW